MTVGPDNALWFVESQNSGSKLARVTTAGHVTEFRMPAGVSFPGGLVTGPDHNLWFTDEANHSDGNMWFTENLGNKVGYIVP
jgi:virginiamycin B lyase